MEYDFFHFGTCISARAVDGPGCGAGADVEGNGREEDNLARGVSSSGSNSELG